MLGFSPLAAAPLADDGSGDLANTSTLIAFEEGVDVLNSGLGVHVQGDLVGLEAGLDGLACSVETPLIASLISDEGQGDASLITLSATLSADLQIAEQQEDTAGLSSVALVEIDGSLLETAQDVANVDANLESSSELLIAEVNEDTFTGDIDNPLAANAFAVETGVDAHLGDSTTQITGTFDVLETSVSDDITSLTSVSVSLEGAVSETAVDTIQAQVDAIEGFVMTAVETGGDVPNGLIDVDVLINANALETEHDALAASLLIEITTSVDAQENDSNDTMSVSVGPDVAVLAELQEQGAETLSGHIDLLNTISSATLTETETDITNADLTVAIGVTVLSEENVSDLMTANGDLKIGMNMMKVEAELDTSDADVRVNIDVVDIAAQEVASEDQAIFNAATQVGLELSTLEDGNDVSTADLETQIDLSLDTSENDLDSLTQDMNLLVQIQTSEIQEAGSDVADGRVTSGPAFTLTVIEGGAGDTISADTDARVSLLFSLNERQEKDAFRAAVYRDLTDILRASRKVYGSVSGEYGIIGKPPRQRLIGE
jgi:hypothetical protein